MLFVAIMVAFTSANSIVFLAKPPHHDEEQLQPRAPENDNQSKFN